MKHLTQKEVYAHLGKIYMFLGVSIFLHALLDSYFHYNSYDIQNMRQPVFTTYIFILWFTYIINIIFGARAIISFFYLLFAGQFKQLLFAVFVFFIVSYLYRLLFRYIDEKLNPSTEPEQEQEPEPDSDFSDL
jgi:hypothetical protein